MSNVVPMTRPVERSLAEMALSRLSQALALYENEVEAENLLPHELGEDIGGLLWAAETFLQSALGTGGGLVNEAAKALAEDPSI